MRLNPYFLNIPMQPEVHAEFCAVCADDANSYAVYVGLVQYGSHKTEASRTKAAEWVATHGTKQTYQQARTYFPNIPEAQYRR